MNIKIYEKGEMEMLQIKGLNRVYIEETEETLFFNNQMLDDNILIEVATTFDQDDNVQTMINVKCLTKDDAFNFTLYWDDLLAPIQVYRIVKDISEIYMDSSLNTFIELAHEFSITSMSAKMQTHEKNRNEIMQSVKDTLDIAKMFK